MWCVGALVGEDVGFAVVGAAVGAWVGEEVGETVGASVGALVGGGITSMFRVHEAVLSALSLVSHVSTYTPTGESAAAA
jgi:hypothetical protein